MLPGRIIWYFLQILSPFLLKGIVLRQKLAAINEFRCFQILDLFLLNHYSLRALLCIMSNCLFI